jgi:hypothetical protein
MLSEKQDPSSKASLRSRSPTLGASIFTMVEMFFHFGKFFGIDLLKVFAWGGFSCTS